MTSQMLNESPDKYTSWSKSDTPISSNSIKLLKRPNNSFSSWSMSQKENFLSLFSKRKDSKRPKLANFLNNLSMELSIFMKLELCIEIWNLRTYSLISVDLLNLLTLACQIPTNIVKIVLFRSNFENCLWISMLRSSWDDRRKKVSWPSSWHLVLWSSPFRNDLWVPSLWRPQHHSSLQKNNGRRFFNTKIRVTSSPLTSAWSPNNGPLEKIKNKRHKGSWLAPFLQWNFNSPESGHKNRAPLNPSWWNHPWTTLKLQLKCWWVKKIHLK